MGRNTITTSNLTQCWQATCPGYVSGASVEAKAVKWVKCDKTALIGIEDDGQTGIRGAATKLMDLGWAVHSQAGQKSWLCPTCSTKAQEIYEKFSRLFG